MRIGFDAKRIFLNQRGLGSYGRNLLQGLLKYHSQSQYYLYTPKLQPLADLNPLWKHNHNLILRTPPSIIPGFLRGIWRSYLIKGSMGNDLLDIYHGLSQEIPLKMPSRRPRVVVTVHDLIFLRYPQFFSAVDRGIYTNKIAHACRHSDRVIAISEQTKSDLITHLRVAEEKIQVIYQSCDEVYYQSEGNSPTLESVRSFNIPHKYILYVGALVPHKNALAILKALKLMKETDCHLVIVGKGKKYYRQLQEFIRHQGLAPRVYFISDHGPVSNGQLAAIYQSASLFVFPSLMEGFGIPIIEAMFSGLPVIVNQQAGLSEAAGNAALEIDVNDSQLLAECMDQILTDMQLRETLILKGRSHVRKFKMDLVTNQVVECYRQLLS